MVRWNVSVVLPSDELEESLEAVLEASLGGVVAAHPTSDPPHLVVLVGPRDLELDHVGGGVGGRGQPAGFQSGGQADGLHRGAHLPPDPDGQVDLGVLVGVEEVSAADHGQHLAGSRLEDHNGGVRMPPPSWNVALHRLLGGLLEVQVDGGLDAQTTLEEQPLPDPATGAEGRVVQEPAPDLLHEMPGRITGLETSRVLLKMGGRGHGSCVLLLGDELVGQHSVQHHVAALEALGVVQERVVSPGQLDDPGDQGRLRQVEVRHVLVEVALGRCLYPVRAVAQVHGVQVLQEDEVLGVLIFQAGGVPDLLELPAGRLLGVADDGQLHVLLGDGGATLADSAGLQVGPGGPDDGLEVEAIVDVEALVLDGDYGVAHHLRDFGQGAGAGPVLGCDQGGDVAPVAGHNHRGLGLLGDGDLKLSGLVAVAGGGHNCQGGHRARGAHEARREDPHGPSLAPRRPRTASAGACRAGVVGLRPKGVGSGRLEAPYWCA